MVFTPDQYRWIAENCDAAAADFMLSPAQRDGYARKAEWYRTLARLGDKPKWATASQTTSDKEQPDATPSLMTAALRSLLARQRR